MAPGSASNKEEIVGSFFKVDNILFYSTFTYPPLQTIDREIRLLKIDARGTGKHSLISGISLKEPPKYLALSYVCGSPHNSVAIDVDGYKFNAFANLASAIDEVRECWERVSDEQEILLWTDQICINQNDDDERSRQVSMMRDIYSHANKTLVRLPASIQVGSHFDSWPQCLEWFRYQFSRLVLSRYPDEKPLTDPLDGGFKLEALEESFIYDVMLAWQDLYALGASKWWTRAWIFQEFLASPNVYFMWMPFLVPWGDLQSLWELFQKRSGLFEYWFEHAKGEIDRNRNYWMRRLAEKGLLTYCELDCNYCGTPEYFHQDRVECKYADLCSVCDQNDQNLEYYPVVRALNAVRHRFNKHYNGFQIMLQTKENPRYFPPRLETFLLQSRFRSTSEPRDRIFAYIGLLGDKCAIIPSYRKPVNTVLVETAQEIIATSGNLNILENTAELDRQSDPDSHLPSWVPAWTKIDWADAIHRPRMDAFVFGDISSSEPEVQYQQDVLRNTVLLKAKGVKLDTLTRITHQDGFAVCSGHLSGVLYGTSTLVQQNDEIWALYGARKLFAFKGTKDSTVTLISQAFVWKGLDIIRSSRRQFTPAFVSIA